MEAGMRDRIKARYYRLTGKEFWDTDRFIEQVISAVDPAVRRAYSGDGERLVLEQMYVYLGIRPPSKALIDSNPVEKFASLVENPDANWSSYPISDSILSHRNDMVAYWKSLPTEMRYAFTNFELNVIMYLISYFYATYDRRPKQDLIKKIDRFIRGADNAEALRHIKV
jgi:hypothetical protein